ncbi:MAG: hypothetical protein WBV79_02950 [Rhodomicrobium sp.]
MPLDALDAHLNPADVVLDNRERFFDIPHVSAKRGNLGRNLILSVVHLRQFLAHLMLLGAHFMLLGAYVMLLGAQTVEFAKDACLLFRQELEIDVFGEDVSHFSLPPVAQRWFYDPAVSGADKPSRACALSFCCSAFKSGDAKSLQYLAECGRIVDCVLLGATGSAVSINLNRSIALYLISFPSNVSLKKCAYTAKACRLGSRLGKFLPFSAQVYLSRNHATLLSTVPNRPRPGRRHWRLPRPKSQELQCMGHAKTTHNN